MAVDTEDLINLAIDARAARDAQRQQIARRREQIVRQLASIPGGRRNRGQIASLQAELGGLGSAERQLHQQDAADQANTVMRANAAFRNAHLAANEAKLNRDADVATQAANLQNGYARLQAKYPNRILDSNQANAFHRELSDLRDANPLGLRNESTAAMIRQATQFHDQERNRVVNKLQDALFKQANLSPEQFVSGLDSARATNVPLKKADGTAPTKDEIEKARATNGQTVAMEVNGVTKLFDRGLFDNLKATFGNQPAPQAVTIPLTPDEQAQAAGFRSAEQAQAFQQGQPLLANAPAGTAVGVDTSTPEGLAASNAAKELSARRMQYLEQNPSAATVVGGGIQGGPRQANFPENLSTANLPATQPTDTRTATLPPGVQPNQPLQPVTQLANQGGTISDVATQPATAPSVDPRTALAQKALDDPNATEAHKAAARQILGIQ